MAHLELEGIRFSYGERAVLGALHLGVAEEELLVILGPSGSGKSTLLRLIAGLEVPSSGSIALAGELATADRQILIAPASRRVSLVFQELALWPHMTCDEHLRFVAPTLGGNERRRLLQDVGLSGFDERLPGHMSGGERQRLALARALASNPAILLLDEPFANVDPGVRTELRRLLVELRARHRVTIVYVTHDLEDAFALADRVAVLNAGNVEQAGLPEELYRHPATPFVATFVGKAAVLPGTIHGRDIETSFGSFVNPTTVLAEGSAVRVVVRPEDVALGEEGVLALVDLVTFCGDRYLVRVTADDDSVWAYSQTRLTPGGAARALLLTGWPLALNSELRS